jgi:acyl-CoA reductase-like NAD-dependent aldehyde dehydrogenase
MGPVIDKANVERIDRIVKDASRYARIIVRGGPIVDGPLAGGAFYRPSKTLCFSMRALRIDFEDKGDRG